MNMLNSIILEGNLKDKAEVKTLNTMTVGTFNIETKRYYKNASGETVEETSDFNCECYGKLADCMTTYKAGRSIRIVGRLKQVIWEVDGKKHSKVVVIVEHIEVKPDFKGE